MSSYFVKEVFFRPDEACAREMSSIPADVHNALRLLLTREGGASVFIPIRSMQYVAVAERDEVIFVDAQGGYAHRNGVGGRLIRLAWHPRVAGASIGAPVPCEMVYYFGDLKGIQARLMAEIGSVLKRMLSQDSHAAAANRQARILPFKQND